MEDISKGQARTTYQLIPVQSARPMAAAERMVVLAGCVQKLNLFQPGLGRALYVGGAKPATCSTPAPPTSATVIPFNFVSGHCVCVVDIRGLNALQEVSLTDTYIVKVRPEKGGGAN